jgi:hypothetical protein
MVWALEPDAADMERAASLLPALVEAASDGDAVGGWRDDKPPVAVDPERQRAALTGALALGERVEFYDLKQDAWRLGTVEEVREPSSTFVVRFACGVRREHHLIADVWRREHAAREAIEALRIGSRLTVFWPGERACFAGKLAAHNGATHLWLIKYDDGDSRVRAARGARDACGVARANAMWRNGSSARAHARMPRSRAHVGRGPQWHNLLACLWMPAAREQELELQVQRISPLARGGAVGPAQTAPIPRPPRAPAARLDFFPAGVVRLRGALDLADQQALVDCSLIAGFFHRTTVMDGVYTRAPGQPNIQLHWNYYAPPERDQPPPLSALELASRVLKLIRSELLWDPARAEQTLRAHADAERTPLRVPELAELEVRSVLGITYGHADSMHWHTDMASEAGWCASLSVGAPARFEFIPIPCEGRATARSAARERAAPVSLALESGDVLLFNGGRLQHRVVSIEPVLAGSAADFAHICAPLGPGVARLVVQARAFGASSAHSYAALLDAGYAAPDDVRERGRLALAATRTGTAAQAADRPKGSKRAFDDVSLG